MALTLDDINSYLPVYLSKEQKEGFVKELKNFPNCNLYTSRRHSDVLQGDGSKGFEIYNFETEKRRDVRAIVLSNTCDIAPENPRALPTKVTFAPLISASRYKMLLEKQGFEKSRISSMFEQLEKQLVTSAFFLPKGANLEEDHFAFLDDIHSMPTSRFLDNGTRSKLFSLSQVGFYLFLMKLSIHFCRMHEGVERD